MPSPWDSAGNFSRVFTPKPFIFIIDRFFFLCYSIMFLYERTLTVIEFISKLIFACFNNININLVRLSQTRIMLDMM